MPINICGSYSYPVCFYINIFNIYFKHYFKITIAFVVIQKKIEKVIINEFFFYCYFFVIFQNVILVNSLVSDTSTCLILTAPNVYFDGNGYNITSLISSSPFSSSGSPLVLHGNATIFNLTIIGGNTPFSFVGSTRVDISFSSFLMFSYAFGIDFTGEDFIFNNNIVSGNAAFDGDLYFFFLLLIHSNPLIFTTTYSQT